MKSQEFLTEQHTYRLWESAGKLLVEAQLTPDQITQLFQQIEQSAAATGGNRTTLGKGKDAVSAVNKAWEDLKTKAQNSGPIKNVDALYDQAAEKLKQATSGDQGVMKYVQKYRDFAKKHPVAQGLIYAALIAAAGISGAGVGGAAAIGLFKMTDKLLQGEKFSSATYSGAKTGATAYAAGQIGKSLNGQSTTAGTTAASTGGNFVSGDDLATNAQKIFLKKVSIDDLQNMDYLTRQEAIKDAMNQAIKSVGGKVDLNIEKDALDQVTMSLKDMAAGGTGLKESVKLSRSDVFVILEQIAIICQRLDEGMLDWVKTKAHNLTTKITADKLMTAWKKAGSPTDSVQLSSFLVSQGVPKTAITATLGKINKSSTTTKSTTPTATPAPTNAAPTAAAPTPNTATKATPTDFNSLRTYIITQMNPAQAQYVLKQVNAIGESALTERGEFKTSKLMKVYQTLRPNEKSKIKQALAMVASRIKQTPKPAATAAESFDQPATWSTASEAVGHNSTITVESIERQLRKRFKQL